MNDMLVALCNSQDLVDGGRAVPFDLFRHDLLMTLSPLADDDIVAIVDEVFLPLVRPAT